ncbi:MAG TPA: ankyrin repeat domain-containing protein, partial [Caulobacteraceae bacterium]|nr:ankyrin repeat domain-containing protein [Caulobacteraceae bacterium]
MRRALFVGFLLMGFVGGAAFGGAREDRLLEAVRNDDHAAVKALLAHHADPNALMADKSSVLAWAVHRQDEESVRLLLKAGADAKATRPDGISALALCAGISTPDIVQQLIAKGADVNAADLKGQTPLMWAAAKGRSDNMA